MKEPNQALRYARHLMLPEVGKEGQSRLLASSVLVIGLGGLGSPVALYLAAAGVGRIGLVDGDRVELGNLQRQVVHDTASIGRWKVDSARERMCALNPDVEVFTHPVRVDPHNIESLVSGYDLVVDGTDNFAARYLINDACHFARRPLVHGSIYRFEGHVTVLGYPHGPCYRCLFPEPPPLGTVPSCSDAGVLGVLPAVVGSIQATEALKCLLGLGAPLSGRLLVYEALPMQFRTLQVARDPACPLCGDHPTIRGLQDAPQVSCMSLPMEGHAMDVTPIALRDELARPNPPQLLDVREPVEWNLAHLPNAKWIPLGELEQRLGELDPTQPLVCYCKAGGRSARAMAFLNSRGFQHVRNLTGGILAWSDQVDPSIPKY